MNKSIKIIFFGNFKEFSKIYLDALKSAGYEIVSEASNADLGAIAYYGKILPKTILEMPKHGFLNAHPSLLPRWRGPSPIQSAILAGDKITGITIHVTTERVDAGSILAQKEISIFPEDTCLSLTDKLAKEGALLLLETIPKWIKGEITSREQHDEEATYSRLLKKEEGEIDWNKDATYIEAMVRAFNPWPGTYTAINQKSKIKNRNLEAKKGGKTPTPLPPPFEGGGEGEGSSISLKIKKVEIITSKDNLKAGEWFEIDGYPAIQCGKRALKLLVVQPAGKKDMTGADFLRGHRYLLK